MYPPSTRVASCQYQHLVPCGALMHPTLRTECNPSDSSLLHPLPYLLPVSLSFINSLLYVHFHAFCSHHAVLPNPDPKLRSIRQPVGKEWNTDKTFVHATKKEVIVGSGVQVQARIGRDRVREKGRGRYIHSLPAPVRTHLCVLLSPLLSF